MGGWLPWLLGLGCIVGFLTIGAVAVYCADQILHQNAEYRCPTCGHPTEHDYSTKEQ